MAKVKVISNEGVGRAAKSLRLGAASYHEKLLTDGYRPIGYYKPRNDLIEKVITTQSLLDNRTVIMPGELVEEAFESLRQSIINGAYVIYRKSR